MQALFCLLITVFLLARVSPSYYVARATAMQRICRPKNASLQKAPVSRNMAGPKADKFIAEDIEVASIPAIKFTGIPFVFFFLLTSLPVGGIKRLPFHSIFLIPDTDISALCILRL
ncbi:MAG: hypothetical protein JST32_10715 [Bacteroidetes bacterium]|nr:hypothetical protein [Bacteroidota bacterium]